MAHSSYIDWRRDSCWGTALFDCFFDTFSTVTAADFQSFSDRSELLPPLEIALLLVIWWRRAPPHFSSPALAGLSSHAARLSDCPTIHTNSYGGMIYRAILRSSKLYMRKAQLIGMGYIFVLLVSAILPEPSALAPSEASTRCLNIPKVGSRSSARMGKLLLTRGAPMMTAVRVSNIQSQGRRSKMVEE